jgi:DNA integrity scanning protein DisA with diadenylate cyclase activity
MNTFTTNEVVYTVDKDGVTTKYKLRVLLEQAGIQLDYAEETIDQVIDQFENLEFGQSVSFHNVNTNYADELIVRKFRRHIPNHNVKPKLHK